MMANKPKSKNWNDVQMVIAAVAIALSLGFWNMFSAPAKQDLANQVDPVTAPPPTETPEPSPTPQIVPTLLPHVKIYLGGAAPQVQQVSAPAKRAKKAKSGGGGSSGTVTTTKTS
jgi:cytochrome oxidase assembly protein ShyY1